MKGQGVGAPSPELYPELHQLHRCPCILNRVVPCIASFLDGLVQHHLHQASERVLERRAWVRVTDLFWAARVQDQASSFPQSALKTSPNSRGRRATTQPITINTNCLDQARD